MPLVGVQGADSPLAGQRPAVKAGFQGTAFESLWRGTSLAMYNRAIPGFPLHGLLRCRCEAGARAQPFFLVTATWAEFSMIHEMEETGSHSQSTRD